VTDIVVSLEYYHADASTVAATQKPQLVPCSWYILQIYEVLIKWQFFALKFVDIDYLTTIAGVIQKSNRAPVFETLCMHIYILLTKQINDHCLEIWNMMQSIISRNSHSQGESEYNKYLNASPHKMILDFVEAYWLPFLCFLHDKDIATITQSSALKAWVSFCWQKPVSATQRIKLFKPARTCFQPIGTQKCSLHWFLQYNKINK